MHDQKTRPSFTAGYICEHLNLGFPWREHIETMIKLARRKNSDLDKRISDMVLNHTQIKTADSILITFIAGIQLGVEMMSQGPHPVQRLTQIDQIETYEHKGHINHAF